MRLAEGLTPDGVSTISTLLCLGGIIVLAGGVAMKDRMSSAFRNRRLRLPVYDCRAQLTDSATRKQYKARTPTDASIMDD